MQYAVNEKVLCFHGPLLYQAKVLDAENWTAEASKTGHTGPHYRVHYQGWKASWDEWVPESRMLKYNDENLARQKALVDSQKADLQRAKEAANPSSASKDGAGADGRSRKESVRGIKRRREAVEAEEDYQKRPEIRINIPDALKLQLCDDWQYCSRDMLLVPLPRDPNVNQILHEFREHLEKRAKNSSKGAAGGLSAVAEEVLAGLKLYFDKSLGANLLYKYERQQFVEMRKKYGQKEGLDASKPDALDAKAAETDSAEREKEKKKKGRKTTEQDSGLIGGIEPSHIYGAEHLLRLFVTLPGIIAHTTMDVESVAILKEHIAEFLQFLAQNRKKYFVQNYETATPAYHRMNQL